MKKNKISIKGLLFLLALLAIMFILPNNVEAATTREGLAAKFNEIQNTSGYKNGEYYKWNDGGWFSDYCSLDHGGWQCHGYGINLFDWLFGQCAMCATKSYDINNLYVGDLVRVDNDSHTIIIQDIVGDTIYYTDANWGYTGTVRWGVKTTRSALGSRVTYIAHASGNNVKTLQVTEPSAPNNIKAINQGGSKVKATWSSVSGVSKYELVIYRASDVKAGNFSNRVAVYGTSGTSYTFSISKGDYYAYVHSYNGVWSSTGGAGYAFSVYPITSVSLNKTSATINKGSTTTLTATISPKNTTDSKTITWSSSNTAVATVNSQGVVTGKSVGTAIITAKTSTGKTKTCTITVKNVEPSISYSTHVQNVGWQTYVSNGATAGTTGKSLRLEGIKINLNSSSYSGGITYSTHIQNIGWQSAVSNNAVSGTSGKSLRLEAIKMNLTGDIANYYDVYYRVHAQNFGWLDWAKNGELAGTAGYSYRLEGIQIVLVKKGNSAPGATSKTFREKSTVSYTTHVQNIGWQKYTSNGAIAGTTGKGLRLEGIKISLNSSYSGGISYSTHVQNIGWQSAVSNNAVSGTSGKSLRLEAIKMNLTGEIAKHYDIYYRVHAQNYGWLGWAKNGQEAGTQGYGYRLEAIQIILVEKGGSAPGSTSNRFVKK